MEHLQERLEKMHCMVLNTSDASQVVYPHQIPGKRNTKNNFKGIAHGYLLPSEKQNAKSGPK